MVLLQEGGEQTRTQRALPNPGHRCLRWKLFAIEDVTCLTKFQLANNNRIAFSLGCHNSYFWASGMILIFYNCKEIIFTSPTSQSIGKRSEKLENKPVTLLSWKMSFWVDQARCLLSYLLVLEVFGALVKFYIYVLKPVATHWLVHRICLCASNPSALIPYQMETRYWSLMFAFLGCVWKPFLSDVSPQSAHHLLACPWCMGTRSRYQRRSC